MHDKRFLVLAVLMGLIIGTAGASRAHADCPADLTGSGSVGVPDLLALLACWGPVAPSCESADLTDSGAVGVPDLLALLANWGPCPAPPSFIQTPSVRTFVSGVAPGNSDEVSSSAELELQPGESLIVAWWAVANPAVHPSAATWNSTALVPVVIDPPSGESLHPHGNNNSILRVYKLETPVSSVTSDTVTITLPSSVTRQMLIAVAIADAQDADIIGTVVGGTHPLEASPHELTHTPGRSNVLVLGIHGLTAAGTSDPSEFSGFSHTEVAQVASDNRLLGVQRLVNADGSATDVSCEWESVDALVASAIIEVRPVEWIALVEDVPIDADASPPSPPEHLGKVATHNIEYYPGGNDGTNTPCSETPGSGSKMPIPSYVANQHEAIRDAYAPIPDLHIFCGQEFFAPRQAYGAATMRILNDYLKSTPVLSGGWSYRVSSAFAIDNRGSDRPQAEQYHPDWPGPDHPTLGYDPEDFDTGECHSEIRTSSPFRPEVVIASKFPIVAAEEIEVLHNTTSDPEYTRGALYAEIELPGERALHIYNIHVRTGSSFNAHRPFVTHAILDHMAANDIDAADDWVIVTGDWNSDPYTASNADHIAMFAKLTDAGFRLTWDNVAEADRITRYTGAGVPTTIDAAYVSEALEADLGVLDAAIIPGSGRTQQQAINGDVPGTEPGIASDHFAFTLTLESIQEGGAGGGRRR